MFEVGKRYEIKMIINGDETTMWRIVEKYEHPLLKFADTERKIKNEFLQGGTLVGEIVNVTSPNFISARIFQEPEGGNPFEKLLQE